jgi:carbon storage regulator
MGLVIKLLEGQKIVIGDVVTIKVYDTRKGQAKLYIEAPKEVSVVRKELLDRQQQGESK